MQKSMYRSYFLFPCLVIAGIIALVGGLIGQSTPVFAEELEETKVIPFTTNDLHKIKYVGQLALSPNDDWVAYVTTKYDFEENKSLKSIFMTNLELRLFCWALGYRTPSNGSAVR